MAKNNTVLKRIHKDLEDRLMAYQLAKMARESKSISFVEATKLFGDEAITPEDKFKEGTERFRKKWKFRI